MKKQTPTRRAKAAKRTGPGEIICQQVISLIADYLKGDLDAPTRSAFEAHLSECENCSAFLRTYQKTLRAVQSLRYEELPPDLQRRALQLVRKRLKR